MAKQRFTVEQVSRALKANKGLLGTAARKLGCSAKTVFRYLERYPTLREEMDEYRGQRLDEAESALDKAVRAGKPWAILFTLRTLGRDRGYVEKVPVAHGGDGEAPPVQLNVHIVEMAAAKRGDTATPAE